MKRKNRLERTAYHEAGHTVACVYLHIPFKYATIKSGEDFLGRVERYPYPESFHPDIDDSPKIRSRIEKDMMISLAGHAAEMAFSGRHNWSGASYDSHKAGDLALYYAGGEEETSAFYNWMWVRTRAWIRQPLHWIAVIALAKELLKEQTITAKEVRIIINKNLKKKLGFSISKKQKFN
jgi:hypothetical protein